jgi:hypothetical protein
VRPDETLARDDDQERKLRLLLLGKGAVLAHRFERPLAAEMDESEQGLDRLGRRRGPAPIRALGKCGSPTGPRPSLMRVPMQAACRGQARAASEFRPRRRLPLRSVGLPLSMPGGAVRVDVSHDVTSGLGASQLPRLAVVSARHAALVFRGRGGERGLRSPPRVGSQPELTLEQDLSERQPGDLEHERRPGPSSSDGCGEGPV